MPTYVTPSEKYALILFTAKLYMKSLPELYEDKINFPDLTDQVFNRECEVFESECNNSLKSYRKRTHKMITKYNKRKENNFYMPEWQTSIINWAKN